MEGYGQDGVEGWAESKGGMGRDGQTGSGTEKMLILGGGVGRWLPLPYTRFFSRGQERCLTQVALKSY